MFASMREPDDTINFVIETYTAELEEWMREHGPLVMRKSFISTQTHQSVCFGVLAISTRYEIWHPSFATDTQKAWSTNLGPPNCSTSTLIF